MSSFYGEDIVQFPDQISNDPRTGLIVRRAWRCTPNAAVAKMNELILAGVKFDHDPGTSGGYQWVIATYAGEAAGQSPSVPLKDMWSLPGNDLEKDVWKHPKVVALLAPYLDPDGAPSQALIDIRREIDDVVAGELPLSRLGTNPDNRQDYAATGWWANASPNMKKFVRNLLRGETSFLVPQFVLRNVKVLASNFDTKPSYNFVGKILTTSEIQNGYNPTPNVKFDLPEGFWLEKTPSVSEQDVYGRYTITREWWHADSYDDFLYDRI